MVTMALKVSCHCGGVLMFNVKNITLESVSVSVSCLSYLFNVAPVAFQAIY